MSNSNKGLIFPNLVVARRLYGLPENATEEDVLSSIIAEGQKLGLDGNTIPELTNSAKLKTREVLGLPADATDEEVDKKLNS